MWLHLAAGLACLINIAAQPFNNIDPLVTDLPLEDIVLPPGFSIQLYADRSVPEARQLALSQGKNSGFPNATIVYVGSRGTNVSTVQFILM